MRGVTQPFRVDVLRLIKAKALSYKRPTESAFSFYELVEKLNNLKAVAC